MVLWCSYGSFECIMYRRLLCCWHLTATTTATTITSSTAVVTDTTTYSYEYRSSTWMIFFLPFWIVVSRESRLWPNRPLPLAAPPPLGRPLSPETNCPTTFEEPPDSLNCTVDTIPFSWRTVPHQEHALSPVSQKSSKSVPPQDLH